MQPTGWLMSRGPHNFKQADVAKAIKAAVKAGVRGWRVELVGGKIVICGEERRDDSVDEGSREWD
jgi:hypothetical protein